MCVCKREHRNIKIFELLSETYLNLNMIKLHLLILFQIYIYIYIYIYILLHLFDLGIAWCSSCIIKAIERCSCVKGKVAMCGLNWKCGGVVKSYIHSCPLSNAQSQSCSLSHGESAPGAASVYFLHPTTVKVSNRQSSINTQETWSPRVKEWPKNAKWSLSAQ